MSYTPRATRRKKNLGLTAKEYTKVTGTIASVRKSRQTHPEYDQDESSDVDSPIHLARNPAHEPSFIAEQSFVRAPLNSRVPNAANPTSVISLSTSLGSAKGKAKQASLDRVPLEIQEVLILEDLLYVLMGIEGTYLTFHQDYSPEDDDPLQGIRFVSHPSLDTSLRDLVERILPLGTYYTAITSFIQLRSHLDFGLVNHALCAAIRDMLKDYQTLLAQLEHAFNTSPIFSLQKLWFYVHPTIHTLSLIYHLVIEVGTADDPSGLLDSSTSSGSGSSSPTDEEQAAREEALGLGGAKLKAVLSELDSSRRSSKGLTPAGENIAVKGGEVLSIIYERMMHMSGDATAKVVYDNLLREAGRPYVDMLKGWVSTGRLVDPYEEMLVKESKFIDRGILEMDYTDEYWERRYTLRDGSTLSGSSQGRHAGVPPPRTANGRLPGGACVPPLLEPWKHKILLAGKYLNVIRECGIEISKSDSPVDVEEDLTLDDERFYKFLEDAYTHANRTLLQLLLKDQQLIPRLRSLKRYFFLSNSFFLTHFLDLASTELRKYAFDDTHATDPTTGEREKPIKHSSSEKTCSAAKLQSLLELVLNMEVNQGDEGMFREDVKITLMSSGVYDFLLKVDSVGGLLVNHNEDSGMNGVAEHKEEPKKKEKSKEKEKTLYGIDVLSLDYSVKFPLSLVISRKTILQYQLLFRFLLHLRHVEQSLSAMWIEQMTLDAWRKSIPSYPDFENWRKRVCLLRARMLAFVQQILGFVTHEVLEPNWRVLEGKLEKVRTVDQLLRDHVDFLDTCLKECMLTSSKLLRAYSKLIVTCSTFAMYGGAFTKQATKPFGSGKDAVPEEDPDDPDSSAKMAKRYDYLRKFETNFNHWFQVHIDCVQYYASSENVSLLPLVARLSSVRPATHTSSSSVQ